jgi:salicylate hydroxylase
MQLIHSWWVQAAFLLEGARLLPLPSQPCTIHGVSLAVEDAAVLGTLMARLCTQDQIPQLTEAFQDIRQERCKRVIDSELNNAALVTLPPGDVRLIRDAAFRASLQTKAWDESELRDQWNEIGETFGYNAREAAEDWWAKWGTLTHRSQTSSDQNFELAIAKVEVQYD